MQETFENRAMQSNSLHGAVTDAVIWNDWYAVARSADLQPGVLVPVRLLEIGLVLWRTASGEVCAWDDRCPHRSVRLSQGKIVDDRVICGYHGLAYAPDGHCVSVPAHPDYKPPKQACVRRFATQEKYGLVFVCLGQPQQEIVEFPEWDDPASGRVITGPHPCKANGYRAIENFLDVAHFSFVHEGILGAREKPEVEDYQVTIDPSGVWLHDIRYWQPDPDGMGQGAFVQYDYWALRPLVASLHKKMPNGHLLNIFYFVTPVSDVEFVGWMCLTFNFKNEMDEAAARAFQEEVFAQDGANLASHSPQHLPLYSPQLEFHLPCDRGSLAYRKWLKQLGVAYGTI
jgi:phenylpropionate dioxygenase-like ring-hydroxylating dioxygenase large terminal subunit